MHQAKHLHFSMQCSCSVWFRRDCFDHSNTEWIWYPKNWHSCTWAGSAEKLGPSWEDGRRRGRKEKWLAVWTTRAGKHWGAQVLKRASATPMSTPHMIKSILKIHKGATLETLNANELCLILCSRYEPTVLYSKIKWFQRCRHQRSEANITAHWYCTWLRFTVQQQRASTATGSTAKKSRVWRSMLSSYCTVRCYSNVIIVIYSM